MQAIGIYPDITAEEHEKRITHITDEILKIAEKNKEKKNTKPTNKA